MTERSSIYESEITRDQRLGRVFEINHGLNNLILSFEHGHHYFLPTSTEITKHFSMKNRDSDNFRQVNEQREAIAKIGVEISRQMESLNLTEDEVEKYQEIIRDAQISNEISDDNLDFVQSVQAKMIEIYHELKKIGYDDGDLGVVELME